MAYASKCFLFNCIAHDCTVHFVSFTADDVKNKSKPKITKAFYVGSPVLTGNFISETGYVASGYDKTPILFSNAKDWSMVKMLDDGFSRHKQSKIGKDAFGGKSAFFDGNKLENDVEVTEKDTKHMNYVNCQKPFITEGSRV